MLRVSIGDYVKKKRGSAFIGGYMKKEMHK